MVTLSRRKEKEESGRKDEETVSAFFPIVLTLWVLYDIIKASLLIDRGKDFPLMARRHDYDLRLRSVKRCMSFRQNPCHIRLPDALIDIDSRRFPDVRNRVKYLRFALSRAGLIPLVRYR